MVNDALAQCVGRIMLDDAGKGCICTLTQQEIGDMLGVPKHAVARIISSARDVGLIERRGHARGAIYKLHFTDPVQLGEARYLGSRKDMWPQSKIDRLVQLRADGNSISACGEVLGISRGAVVGKLRRIEDAKRKQTTTEADARDRIGQHTSRQGQTEQSSC